MDANISPTILDKSPLILEELKRASSILLHCHPSPDPDSVGSALAMRFALEQMGKKVTVISGDSAIPEVFMSFPGARDISSKSFVDVEQKDFDLFIALDSGALTMVSRRGQVKFLESMKVIIIDHHASNEEYGNINLVEKSYPSTTQILYDLFKMWDIKITPEIAANLFIGTYTDTGGFKYKGTTDKTFLMAAELVKVVPNFPEIIFAIESCNTPGFIAFQAMALNNIETFLGGSLALASVSNETLKSKKISSEEMSSHFISSMLRSVIGWDIDVALVEVEPNKVKASFRSRDNEKYDLTVLAGAFGGGGHKAAAGAVLDMSLAEAKEKIVSKTKELYNL
ncbi:MAG: bifunctional oligoribonuclease/PAP phosphatase NrnA [Candidatus Paceibacterota bacterium]|jgi:phosphoesterase RecJ-like protein